MNVALVGKFAVRAIGNIGAAQSQSFRFWRVQRHVAKLDFFAAKAAALKGMRMAAGVSQPCGGWPLQRLVNSGSSLHRILLHASLQRCS